MKLGKRGGTLQGALRLVGGRLTSGIVGRLMGHSAAFMEKLRSRVRPLRYSDTALRG